MNKAIYFNSFGFIVFLIYFIAIYVFNTISLYTIAKRNGVKYSWLSFIPIVQYYVIGTICEEYVVFGVRISRLGFAMPLLFLLRVITLIFSSTIFVPLRFVITALIVLIMHKFFYLFTPQRALMFAGLCLLGDLPMTIILYIIKDISMQMSAGAYMYPFPNKPR